MKQYYVGAIIKDKGDEKARIWEMEDSVNNMTKAKEILNRIKDEHNVLSACVDVVDERGVRETVYKECAGNVMLNIDK